MWYWGNLCFRKVRRLVGNNQFLCYCLVRLLTEKTLYGVDMIQRTLGIFVIKRIPWDSIKWRFSLCFFPVIFFSWNVMVDDSTAILMLENKSWLNPVSLPALEWFLNDFERYYLVKMLCNIIWTWKKTCLNFVIIPMLAGAKVSADTALTKSRPMCIYMYLYLYIGEWH